MWYDCCIQLDKGHEPECINIITTIVFRVLIQSSKFPGFSSNATSLTEVRAALLHFMAGTRGAPPLCLLAIPHNPPLRCMWEELTGSVERRVPPIQTTRPPTYSVSNTNLRGYINTKIRPYLPNTDTAWK